MTKVLPDLQITRITDFIGFAERPTPRRHWLQSVWAWAATRGMTAGSIEQQRQLATDVRNGVCESAFCAAGHGAFDAGYRLVYDETVIHNGTNGDTRGITASMCIPERPKMDKETGLPVLHGGHQVWEDVPHSLQYPVAVVGQNWYGLSDDEADAFFLASNDLSTMKRLVNGFCGARSWPPAYPDLGALDAYDHLVAHGERYPDDEEEEVG